MVEEEPEEDPGWMPPEVEDEPGPLVLAMAHEGDTKQLIAFGDRGEPDPFGPPIPNALAYNRLKWNPDVGRGAVLLSTDDDSAVYGIANEELTELGASLPAVVWIELSREAHLVVLHHLDRSTSIVDHEDTLVFTLPPAASGNSNWVAFGDADRWVAWSDEPDPDAFPSYADYSVHQFASRTTSQIGTWDYSGRIFYTFETSVMVQRPTAPDDTRWVDLSGAELDIDGAPKTVGVTPGRFFFDAGSAYEIRDRAVVEVAPQVVPEGRVRSYVPGAFAFVERLDGGYVQVAPDGTELGELTGGEGAEIAIIDEHLDPVAPQALARLRNTGETEWRLWRPQGESVYLRNDADGVFSAVFTADGTLVRVELDGTATAILPESSEEVDLDLSPYTFDGFEDARD